MSHDIGAAILREKKSNYNKPWYLSCSNVLEKNNLKGCRCLDLCSGNCEYSEILRDVFKMEVVCADYVPLHLEKAERAGFENIHIDLDGESDRIEKSIKDYLGSFDLVINLAAIEHVFSSDKLMEVSHNLLKPSGFFVINTPNIGFLAYRIYSLLNGNRPYGEGHHIRFWDFRFLRTCLFFNGFEVAQDYRGFFSLPEEILRRAFKNRTSLSKLASQFFYVCFFLQKFSFCRDWATDELTVLCRKMNVEPIPFDYFKIKTTLENDNGDELLKKDTVIRRLKDAKQRGWLKEHIYLSQLTEMYS